MGKQDNRLHMICVREHIDGLNLFDALAVFAKEQQVAPLGLRVAGDIHHPRGCKAHE